MKKLARVEVRWSKKDGFWHVKARDGVVRPFMTKKAAIRCGVQVAKSFQPSQLFIRLKDGTFQEERTYPRSRDPRQTKG